MKGVVITAEKAMSIQDFGEPLFKTVGEVVGGYIEHVNPVFLQDPYCMIVNEEGLLKGLPLNPIGSYLYGTHIHQQPIVGTIVIMKDGYRNGEPDIVGLEDNEAERLRAAIANLANKVFSQGGA